MEDLDLYNVRSVRLAETTKVKLFLPGLGSGLWEEEDNTKSGTLNSADAKKAKKRLAKMRKACNVGPGEADGIMVILEEEKQTEDDPDSDSDSDEDGESLLPSFLLNMTNFHPALAAEPSQKKKKPVDKWLVNKKDPWAKQSGRNAPIMGQTSPWSELNRQGSE